MSALSRRHFLLQSAAAGMASMLPVAAGTTGTDANAVQNDSSTSGTPPNIVLIMLDTVRADKLGCYGGSKEVSPALDRIAEKGIVFERAIAQCSWTRPSCGSLLSSRHPRNLGLYVEKDEILDGRFDTLAKALKRSGYATFGATANPNLNRVFNFHLGFDTYVESSVVFGWMPGADRENLRGRLPLPAAPQLFEQALAFAAAHPAVSCFLQLNLMEVHEWYVRDAYSLTRGEYRGMFKDSGERFPAYLEAVRQLTDDTARFVMQLSGLPGWDNTIFAIISDHGEGLDDRPGIAKSLYHGWLLYESQVVVPWILYWPRWNVRTPRIRQPVRLLELAPTLLGLAGAPPLDGAEGVSLKPLLDGTVDKAALPEYFITETEFRGARKVGAYAPDWKYFENLAVHAGLPPRELQRRGGRELGTRSDQFAAHPELTDTIRRFVDEWMASNVRAAPTLVQQGLSEEEKRQLEAIGYLGGQNETAP